MLNLRNKYLKKWKWRKSKKVTQTKKLVRVSIKKDKKELIFDLKRKKSKDLDNHETNTFK